MNLSNKKLDKKLKSEFKNIFPKIYFSKNCFQSINSFDCRINSRLKFRGLSRGEGGGKSNGCPGSRGGSREQKFIPNALS